MYATATDRTTLNDSAALFIEGELVGKLINAGTTQRKEALITFNSGTTIAVVGDLTGYVAWAITTGLSTIICN